mgnify:CR=1 FL=1
MKNRVRVGRWVVAMGVAAACVGSAASAATFKVRAADGVGPDVASGRLVVFVIADASLKKEDGSGGVLNPKTLPLDGPLWDSAEPIFATDVAPEGTVTEIVFQQVVQVHLVAGGDPVEP